MRDLSNHELTVRLLSLEQAFNASTKRAIDNTYTAESANSKADALTPTTFTKTAYIGDTEIYFNGVTDGIPTIYVTDTEGNTPRYTVSKAGEGAVSFRIRFEMPLEYVTTITLSIS